MGYTELFSSCCADLGVHLDLWRCPQGISGVAERKSRLLSCLMGNAGWHWNQCIVFGPHLAVRGDISWFLSNCGGNLRFSLELRQRCPLNTCVLSATSGLLSSFQGHLGILLELWQDSLDTSRVEGGDPGFLSSCHWDVGIPINFQEESGIVSS